MGLLIHDYQQALVALESIASDTDQPLHADQRNLLRRVAVELLAMCRAPKRRLAPQSDSPTNSPVTSLTPREIEVAKWIANGLTDGEIAGVLGISTRTVNTHRDRLLQKLHVRSRSSIASWMTKHYRHLLSFLLLDPLAIFANFPLDLLGIS